MINNLKEGDQFVAVSDGKGGFKLFPKNSTNKSGAGGGCGTLFLYVLLGLWALIVLLLLVGIICIPFLLAIVALYQDNESSKRLRIYSIGIFIVISAILFLIFPQINSLKALTADILSYKKTVNFFLILNGIGVSSAILGLIKVASNKFNTIYTIVTASLFILFSLIFNKDEILSFLKDPPQYFTSEQLSIACDCYNESLTVTNMERMDLSNQAREKRDYCYNLFAKDYDYNEHSHEFIDQRMKVACEKNNPNNQHIESSNTNVILPINSDDRIIMQKMVGEWKVIKVNSNDLSPKNKAKLEKIQLLITDQVTKFKYDNGVYSEGNKYFVSHGKYYENNVKVYDSIWFEKNNILRIKIKIEDGENVELEFKRTEK